MDWLVPQAPHSFGDFVLLEKADRSDAGRTRIKAGLSVLERDATQGKNGDFLPARFTQSIEAGKAGLLGVLLFKYRGEHGEVGPLGGGTRNVGRGMTRNTD